MNKAEFHYRKVLEAEPSHFDALNNLGLLLERQNNLIEAIVLTRRAIELNAHNAQSHRNLGRMLSTVGLHEDARAAFEKSVALEPADIRTLAQLIAELRVLKREEEAVPLLERAIQLQPQNAEAHHLLGGLLHGIGRPVEARHCFEKAVALRPNGHYYRDLAVVTRFDADSPYLEDMEALLSSRTTMPSGERMALHFALAKAYADRGLHEQSFRNQLEANRIRRSETIYDEPAAMAWIERTKSETTADVLRAKAGLGISSEVPVFVVGMPRCGSTLVEQILASHPGVFALGENAAFENSVRTVFSVADLPGAATAATPDQLRAIGADYLASVSRFCPGALRITNKMLPNFLYAGLIHLVFPNARIIHVRRNAVDTCLSCFSQEFPAGAPYLFNLGELGRYYRAYAGLMDHWRKVLPPTALLEIHYEDIVADLETQARRMVSHCGLDWDDACLSFDKSTRHVWTASATQVRQPIYTSSIGRWRPSAEAIRPLLEGLGDAARGN